jgi:hypothetical protein
MIWEPSIAEFISAKPKTESYLSSVRIDNEQSSLPTGAEPGSGELEGKRILATKRVAYVAGVYCTNNLPKVEKCQGLTYLIINMLDLDGCGESAHATRIFLPQFLSEDYRHAEITIPHGSFTNLAVVTSHQSNVVRRFRRNLHGCRPMSRLQELQVLQALCQGRREVRGL